MMTSINMGERPTDACGQQVIKLRAGVQCVSQPGGESFFVSPQDNWVRVGRAAKELWHMLHRGTNAAQLTAYLAARYPQTPDIAHRVAIFVGQLQRANLLEGSYDVPKRDGVVLCRVPIDGVARTIAHVIGYVPTALAAIWGALLVGAALVGIGWFVNSPTHTPHLLDLLQRFSLPGLLCFVGIVIPLHELSHAVACRLVGVPVTEWGIELSSFGLPVPYVSTPAAAALLDRKHSVWIPAAGPLCNVVLCGIAAWLSLTCNALRDAASFVFLCTLCSTVAGTTLLQESDGSHVLAALLHDPQVRTAALSRSAGEPASRRNIRLYRALCVTHVLGSLALLVSLMPSKVMR
jgi:putative peptide zinc metalloprotease protein